MSFIQRADFVSVPVRDMKRAKRFYRDSAGNALTLHRRHARVEP